MKYTHTGIALLCKLFGKTRDAWYKTLAFKDLRFEEESLILETVHHIRSLQPTIGTSKLTHEIKLRLGPFGVKIGKNRMGELLRANNLLVKQKRRGHRTTYSNHHYRKWPNLIEELIPERPEQLLVCDITYWRIEHGFIYVSLATDAYSHMIMGYHVSQDLYTTGPLAAMQMVLDNRIYPDSEMIHHSDRGFQYCSNAYVALLQDNDIAISMTQTGDPRDNAIAERINGILKQKFGLPRVFESYLSALEPIKQAVNTYNQEFPHGSIDYLKPYQAHQIRGPIKSRWKKN